MDSDKKIEQLEGVIDALREQLKSLKEICDSNSADIDTLKIKIGEK